MDSDTSQVEYLKRQISYNQSQAKRAVKQRNFMAALGHRERADEFLKELDKLVPSQKTLKQIKKRQNTLFDSTEETE